MAKLPRKTQKIFCSKPTSENQTSVFGTMKTADKQYSTDVGTLQSNAAYEQGWKSATIANYKPFMEDFNTLNYINTSQLAYLFQQGIPEWDEATAYYKNSFCSYNGDLWQSLIDDNLGNAPFEGDEWALFSTKNKGGGLELCDTDIVIRDDKKMFTQLQQMRRSTFDLSKFTVAGSPTITEDGVASGFSVNSYINVQNVNFSSNNFKLKIRFKTPQIDPTTNQLCFGIGITPPNALFYFGRNTKYGPNKYFLAGVQNSIITLLPNTWYDYIWIRKNEQDSVFYKLSTDTQYTTVIENQTVTQVVTSNSIRLGTWSHDLTVGYIWQGSIDLKQFSITVDGKEVFSGNKTGLDVIKPDNYTVVGSPVISEDGIASGFSASNYLQNKNPYNSFIANMSYIWNGSNPTGSSFLYRFHNLSESEAVSIYQASNGQLEINTRVLSTSYYDFGRITINPNVPINIILIKNDTSIKADVYQNNISIFSKTVTTHIPTFDNETVFQIGNTSVLINGSIDLNAFKIYVDGNLVYQPCLKIPYTQSKTGSKIVDGVYRDRVIDLYEQEGQAGYYTIDEPNKNFTLPMGEIYGMIETKADKITVEESLATKADVSTPSIQAPYLKDTYVNGTSWYRIWSDGWCEQGGIAQVNANTKNYTVNLLKNYKDIYYNISCNQYFGIINYTNNQSQVPYDALNSYSCATNTRTISSFRLQYITTGQNRFVSWQTCGYLAQGEF